MRILVVLVLAFSALSATQAMDKRPNYGRIMKRFFGSTLRPRNEDVESPIPARVARPSKKKNIKG